MQEQEREAARPLVSVTPLAMVATAVPLFMWSAFYAGFFPLDDEAFLIPLALFLGAPIALGTALWAYARRDGYLGAALGALAGFWASYGMMLWLMQQDVVGAGASPSDLRGLLFAVWAATFAIIWLGSMREDWTRALVMLGVTAMFVLLSIGEYSGTENWLEVGGWVGFVTAVVAWYTALAELINTEFARRVLPAGTPLRLRTRSR